MKLLKKVYLSFVFVLLKGQLLLAYTSGGYELFCHDWLGVPGVNNHVLPQVNNIIPLTMVGPAPAIPFNNCAILSWMFPAVPVAPGPIALPPLILANQAELALMRFVEGITNGHHDLNNFAYPLAILYAAFGIPIPAGLVPGMPAGYLPRALASGGYNTTSARLLYRFPFVMPLGIAAGTDTVAVLLSLNRRASKDLKDIHWNSTDFSVMLFTPFGVLVHDSMKRSLNLFFPLATPPNSATIVTFRETSVN